MTAKGRCPPAVSRAYTTDLFAVSRVSPKNLLWPSFNLWRACPASMNGTPAFLLFLTYCITFVKINKYSYQWDGRASGCSLALGMRIWKTVIPSLSIDWTSISQPWDSTMDFTDARPRPKPSPLREESPR